MTDAATTDPHAPSLSCSRLVRYLGSDESRVAALRSVSLDLFPGFVYSVVGPSGCGKSTLLYLLGLLDKPDEGSITIAGRDVSQLTDNEATRVRNELLGFVFQFHFLIKEFSAAENVMLPMRRLGRWSESAMEERATHLLEQVGLAAKRHRKANHLSGGEQQRVAIARALANDPRVILADEPTGNLDTANSDRVFAMLTGMAHDNKITLLLVTHNPAIADASDCILNMRDGQFVEKMH